MVEKSLNAVIVGGSLTGLFQGVVLKKLGCNVRILERAGPDDLREQGAGITAGEETKNFNSSIKVNIPLRMTSWDTLYYRLRANFDGLQSVYIAIDRHTPETAAGAASYEFGCNVTDVKYNMGSVEVNFERLTGGGETLHAADGPASSIRRMLCPGTERKYVGYVAWRGTVVESQISDETKALFRTYYFIYAGGHILIYLIPGKNSSLKLGEGLLNYVWYCNYVANSPELRNLMTDTEGHYHRVTMPMGKIRPEVCARQMVPSKSDRLTIQAYESQVLRYAKLTSLMSVAWGNQNQFSIWIYLGSVFWLALAYVEVSAGALWKWLTGPL